MHCTEREREREREREAKGKCGVHESRSDRPVREHREWQSGVRTCSTEYVCNARTDTVPQSERQTERDRDRETDREVYAPADQQRYTQNAVVSQIEK